MIKQNHKLIALFKSGQDQALLNLWRRNHPLRYSEEEIGLNSWKSDVKDALDISDDQILSKMLDGVISWDIISSARSWSDVVTLFPHGNDIRDRWQSSKQNKGFGAFLAWFDSAQPKTTDEILIGIASNDKSKKINKSTISGKMEEEHDSNIRNYISGDDSFFQAILVGIGAPVTKNNINYLYAWRQAEGGHATFNPFNTTMKREGATNYNSVGVKNYISEQQGIEATVSTLLDNRHHRYDAILSALKNDSDPMITAEALVSSPWGTGELAKKVISGYQAGATPKPPPIARA